MLSPLLLRCCLVNPFFFAFVTEGRSTGGAARFDRQRGNERSISRRRNAAETEGFSRAPNSCPNEGHLPKSFGFRVSVCQDGTVLLPERASREPTVLANITVHQQALDEGRQDRGDSFLTFEQILINSGICQTARSGTIEVTAVPSDDFPSSIDGLVPSLMSMVRLRRTTGTFHLGHSRVQTNSSSRVIRSHLFFWA
jgi:hypothetical protein